MLLVLTSNLPILQHPILDLNVLLIVTLDPPCFLLLQEFLHRVGYAIESALLFLFEDFKALMLARFRLK